MRTTSLVALSCLLSLAPAVAGVAVDYDREAEFSGYATYAWAEGTTASSPLAQKRIESAVNAALAAEGLELVEDDADLLVVTHARVENEQRVDVDDYGYWRRWRGWGTTHVDVYDVAVGTLIVDLLDGASGELVWRGVASDTVSDNPDKNEKKIRKVVTKMFKKYPPK